jgi:hypothetical protein
MSLDGTATDDRLDGALNELRPFPRSTPMQTKKSDEP